MRTIENPDAVFDAVVLSWDALAERWVLRAAGTVAECFRYVDQVRVDGYQGRMQLIHQQRRVFIPPKEDQKNPNGG